MATPERSKNIQFVVESFVTLWILPSAKEITQAKTNTTTVRIAVAKLESTPFIPTFARIETSAANTADMMEATNQLGIRYNYHMTILILILALGLRLVLLHQSLWLDEAIEALALMGKQGPLLKYALADFQPPLYHFVLSAVTHLFGFSEITLRLPSLISGVLTVYFMIKIGSHLAGQRVGWIAGLLAATNPLLIYYSQEGRTYAMTAFLVTASFYYFIQLLKNKNSSKLTSLLYLLTSMAFLWTSYLSWFVYFSQVVYALWKKRRDLILLQATSALTLLAWLPFFITSLRFGLRDAANLPVWGQIVGGASAKAIILTWVKMNIGRISFANKYLYAFIVGSLAALHFFVLKKSRPLSRAHWPLIIWLLFPVLLGSLFSLVVPVYSYTRVLFIVPAYLLLLALGLPERPVRTTYLCLAVNLIFLAIFWFTPSFHREDWRSLVRDLNAQPAILVALPSLRTSAPLTYYGLTHPLVELPSLGPTTLPVYYLRYGEDIFDPSLVGQAKLRASGYTITKQQTYPGIQVDVYEQIINH